jgi:hypothetical protein
MTGGFFHFSLGRDKGRGFRPKFAPATGELVQLIKELNRPSAPIAS